MWHERAKFTAIWQEVFYLKMGAKEFESEDVVALNDILLQ